MDGAHFVLLPLFLIIAFWVLYTNGFLILSSKRALAFIGTRQGREASFTACTGQIKRVVRFPESRTFHFAFSPELTRGEVSAALLDHGTQLLVLDSAVQNGAVSAEKGRPYTLVIRFRSASGKYTLHWN
ncbi:MAG: hypothetical protein E7445_05385 [Ruminococcaceae bacterium]|nr:hypothetical protein [Oscillospiraceae bacterium]